MYTNESYQQNRSQLRSHLICYGLPVLLLFVLMLVSFFLRWAQAVTIILSIFCFGLFILFYSLFISPVVAYGRHIDHALNGRTRQTSGAFLSMEEEAVSRDGVMFYPFMINVGDKEDEADHRLFYMDANLPRPNWKEDDMLTITSYDNRVTAWEKA